MSFLPKTATSTRVAVGMRRELDRLNAARRATEESPISAIAAMQIAIPYSAANANVTVTSLCAPALRKGCELGLM
jgi:hypothetical protein